MGVWSAGLSWTRKIGRQMLVLRGAAVRILRSPLGRTNMASSRPSSDLAAFRKLLASAKSVVVLTGAGVSAESGVPTFRGAGGFWRRYQAQDLATPGAFYRDPSLVWEFYHYRREVMLSKSPNPAHLAIAECAERLKGEGRRLRVITQVASRGIPVAEFNMETTPATQRLGKHGFYFEGPCGTTLPPALAL